MSFVISSGIIDTTYTNLTSRSFAINFGVTDIALTANLEREGGLTINISVLTFTFAINEE